LPPLKLIALDHDDLGILSANLQDAVAKVGDMAYQRGARRFAMLVNRFDWEHALATKAGAKIENRRRRSAIRFERVLSAQAQGIDLKSKSSVLSLLAIRFEPHAEPPGGTVTLLFAGNAAIRLEVECVEAELRDLGAVWRAKRQPQHASGDSEEGG
jgi:hypothetical protein